MTPNKKIVFNSMKAFINSLDGIPFEKWNTFISAVWLLNQCGALTTSQTKELHSLINSKISG